MYSPYFKKIDITPIILNRFIILSLHTVLYHFLYTDTSKKSNTSSHNKPAFYYSQAKEFG